MTRFLLSLNDAVDTVFAALRAAKAGETFIPRAPAASVMNIAKALIGNRRVPIKVTGVRPGEKLHEVLVSEEEVHHCVKRGAYYVIRPMLPELRGGEAGQRNVLSREYSSGDDVLSLTQTVQLLKRNRLMVEDRNISQGEELLR
jgi:UDP-glucose 4-epimerase